ncbi:MAG: class I SAM-dependent methyltransferase [Gammaproteobacteria bacterium]
MYQVAGSDSSPPDISALKDARTAEEFYDARYREGYMVDDDWSAEKLRRVETLIRELGLPPKGRALDFGCGQGVFTAVLRKALPSWEIHGTDISTDAMRLAQARLPDCKFHTLSECETIQSEFDFVFSHHVLEHVSDLPQTAGLIGHMLAPTGTMLHIMPCGNPGSFVHGICLLRRDGIDTKAEHRFFYDESGHLRRLTTETLVNAGWGDRFNVKRAYYANRTAGEIRSVTRFGLDFVLQFADPSKAVNGSAAARLWLLRAFLVLVWALRKPADVVRNKLRSGCHGLRDVVLLGASFVLYPVAAAVNGLLDTLAAREWARHREDCRGSEMYVALSRATSN